MVVVLERLERLDEVPVCDGRGVTGVVVLSETELVVDRDGDVVVGVAGAGAGV